MKHLQSLVPFLVISGQERLKQVPVRILLMVVISWGLTTCGCTVWVGPWLLFACAVQAFEIWSLAPFRHGRKIGSAAIILGLASTFVMALTYAGMSVFLWREGSPVLVTLAALTLSGGLLTNIASGIASRLMFAIGGAPYLVGLIALGYFEISDGHVSEGAMMLSTSFLGVVSILNVYVRVHKMHKTTVVALEEAEDRLNQAQAAMAERSAMAAIVSHELRTPLSAILAGAQIVRTEKDEFRREDTADLIIDAGRLMNGMLNDLLDHSKMQAGAMTLERRDFELNRFVVEAGRFWQAAVTAKGLTLEISEPGDMPIWVKGDSYRLRQIINNLMSNAVKFSAQGKIELKATVKTEGEQVHLTLSVRDQGMGIPPEAMDRLFSPFSQASSEVARTYGGTGLGLSVSRDLARLMGGDLVAPAAEGQGALFVLSLPLGVGQPSEAPTEDTPPQPAAVNKMRILVVDDHEVNRRTMALVLHPLGVDLTTAANGQEALERLEERPFDAVLMDVNMPGIDGNETTRRLRAGNGPNRNVPVIGISAGTEDREVQACFNAGMTDWLAKPLEPRKLYEALQKISLGDGAAKAVA